MFVREVCEDYYEIYEHKCEYCGKEFRYSESCQVPGFRMKDEVFCPNCHRLLFSSMEYEYEILKD